MLSFLLCLLIVSQRSQCNLYILLLIHSVMSLADSDGYRLTGCIILELIPQLIHSCYAAAFKFCNNISPLDACILGRTAFADFCYIDSFGIPYREAISSDTASPVIPIKALSLSSTTSVLVSRFIRSSRIGSALEMGIA